MNCSSAPFIQTYLDRSGKRAVGVRLEHLLYKKRVACRENQPRKVVAEKISFFFFMEQSVKETG